ncbi:MAG: hypothetical protein QXY05_03335 [Candidatus Anstonellales archaeon]
MTSEVEDEVYRVACGLPFSEYEKKLMEIGKNNPAIVINTLLQPEFICKSYQSNSVCKILKELVKMYPSMIWYLASGLKFSDSSEEEDIKRRKLVKKIFMEISNENSRYNSEIIKEMCKIMFKNTGYEPFEIVSGIVLKNVELSFILMEWLRKRLEKEKESVDKVYLRREMMNMLLDIMKHVETERRAAKIAESIIPQLGTDKFFEDALVEIAKKFYEAKKRVENWNCENETIRNGLKRVNERLRRWEEEYKRPNQVRASVSGFRGTKHKHGF